MMTMNTKRWMIGAAAVASLLLGAGQAMGEDLWLHVRVEEDGGATKVKVNLPMSVLEKGLPLIEDHHIGRHGIVIDDADMDVAELREIWAELQASPDMTFVTVEEENESVKVSKSGGYMLVHVEERDGGNERVEARIPLQVVDALLSGGGEELDLAAAMAALVEHGAGELVTVQSDDETVRVWVDGVAEAD